MQPVVNQNLIQQLNFSDQKTLLQYKTQEMSLKDQHLQRFWGKWLRGGSNETDEKQAPQSLAQDDDNSDWDTQEDAWDGTRRPGLKEKEQEYERESGMQDEWESDDDDDDDDHGG